MTKALFVFLFLFTLNVD